MIAALCVFLSCAGLGIMRAGRIKREYRRLIYLKKVMILLRGEISYAGCGIAESFSRLSKRVREPYAILFWNLSEKVEQQTGETFHEIWREEMILPLGSYFTKKEPELERLDEIGENLGYLDRKMQCNYITLYLEQLQLTLDERAKNVPGECRLNSMLGILGGIFLVICLW